MPSATDRISETGQEDVLTNDLIVKLSIRDDSENTFIKHSSSMDGKSNVNGNASSSSSRLTAPFAASIASILSAHTPTLTAEEAFQRCHELELQLKAEQKMVSKLKYQLEQSERMLSQLRSVHSKCPFDTKFEDLPEELIVTIFSYLSSDLLLDVVSQVCHQWQRLCRDRMLWSKISVKKDLNEIIRAMTVAPCLQSVYISSEYLTVHDDVGDEQLQVLTTSPCRVRSLTLPDFQPIALRMVRNQLGYLRHLHVHSWWDHQRAEFREDLWHTLAELDLVSLTLHEYDGRNSYFHTDWRPAPGQLCGLRHLDLYCKLVPQPSPRGPLGGVVDALVEASKDTLETVSLPPKTEGRVIEALAQCPLLREANVPFLEEVRALEACPLLEALELNSEWLDHETVRVLVPRVAAVLRGSALTARLRTLFFQGMTMGCRELLRAVADLRGLRYVRIHNFGEPEAAAELPAVLGELVHLERFTIATMPAPAVLDAIPAEVCPGLRELTVIGSCHEDTLGCRVPAALRLLRHRPALHVFLDLGLGVRGHLENAYPQCMRAHGRVCEDESLWHRFHPVMVNHDPTGCSWCRDMVEHYATVVDMRGKLDED
ncbi:uncharacterized protein LOC113204590 [Frankliniella occidentalis]|uniref:Uncharacterized protein LOC113204590 n=1 Tax=Frankliniella occidentalis TaxID=133901 RepID=A0A9C6U0C5_FRAOC|nr:uncharacterized protein LOC113204590 [Frankliniella occidentalis]